MKLGEDDAPSSRVCRCQFETQPTLLAVDVGEQLLGALRVLAFRLVQKKSRQLVSRFAIELEWDQRVSPHQMDLRIVVPKLPCVGFSFNALITEMQKYSEVGCETGYRARNHVLSNGIRK